MNRLRLWLRVLVTLVVIVAAVWLVWHGRDLAPQRPVVPPSTATEARDAAGTSSVVPSVQRPVRAPSAATAGPAAAASGIGTPPRALPEPGPGVKSPAAPQTSLVMEPARPFDSAFIRLGPLEVASLPEAVRFDYPMGSQNAALTYNAQPFRITRHLGDDLNGIGGENSDLGDAVFAAGTGRVVYAGVPGAGWGNMIILAHRVQEAGAPGGFAVYQTLYAHLEKSLVRPDQLVTRGEQIGTVGTAGGQYFAHLHFEVRAGPYVNPGVGYADTPLNRLSPEKFIDEHRGAPVDQLNQAPHP
ncbi:MAG: M23 family metallopeptidase [Verrucomicrobiaceae bacterium]|nr:M23 family metallopeptidase [Verrucomicrobiaceae bacterium]